MRQVKPRWWCSLMEMAKLQIPVQDSLCGHLDSFSLHAPCYSADFSLSSFPPIFSKCLKILSILNLPMLYEHTHSWNRIILPYELADSLAKRECYLQGSHQEASLPGNPFCDFSPYWCLSFLPIPINHRKCVLYSIFISVFYVYAKIFNEVFEIDID